jgi:hypothetical protein
VQPHPRQVLRIRDGYFVCLPRKSKIWDA